MTRMVTIALDPGHGGEDPGAIGRGGNYEKNVVLAIATRLKAKLEQQPNTRVMLTRDGDYFVPLHVRVQKARKDQGLEVTDRIALVVYTDDVALRAALEAHGPAVAEEVLAATLRVEAGDGPADATPLEGLPGAVAVTRA
jgi:hypothetical protein